MKLTVYQRLAKKKSDNKQARRGGKIPAVLYVRGQPSEALLVGAAEFDSALRQMKRGRLATTKLTLVNEKGEERSAIIKDVQYHVTNYDVLHLDFEELIDEVKVNLNVPIECTGVADCVGVKLGGVLRQVIRHLRVHCLPEDIPEVFEIDVKSLAIKQSKKLRDIKIPPGVRPLGSLEEVAVVIAKR
ncbi:MAG: 50S ribosomal protein L25/general stress protein Ctc [Waddliaceae bacterium]